MRFVTTGMGCRKNQCLKPKILFSFFDFGIGNWCHFFPILISVSSTEKKKIKISSAVRGKIKLWILRLCIEGVRNRASSIVFIFFCKPIDYKRKKMYNSTKHLSQTSLWLFRWKRGCILGIAVLASFPRLYTW